MKPTMKIPHPSVFAISFGLWVLVVLAVKFTLKALGF